MAGAAVTFTVDASDLQRVVRAMNKLGEDGGAAKKMLFAEMKAVAAPFPTALKASIMGVESTAKGGHYNVGRAEVLFGRGKKQTHQDTWKSLERRAKSAAKRSGLRNRIAAGIYLRTRSSGPQVGCYVSGAQRMLPADQKPLPRGLNSPNGWGHPTYGHKDRTVHQQGVPTGWWDTVAKKAIPAKYEIERAIRAWATELKV